jgi:hypothetical protein
LVVWSVMVLWVATDGATMKPRASYGCLTQGCTARHALVSWFLVMIHCRTTSMWYFLVILPWLSSHILSEDPYIGPVVVELPPEVAKRMTFEEQSPT